MPVNKTKKSLTLYPNKVGMERREEILRMITQSQTGLPQNLMHDDLDRGFLDYIKSNYQIVSDGKAVPIIDRIMTIQRWGEYTQNWQFSDSDGNIEIPFIAIIRNPEVNYGTHPVQHYNVPQNQSWYFSTVQNFENGIMGADVYQIPQPTPIDIKFDVAIVCTKFRDLNAFNGMILQNLNNMQSYQVVNGHYIPIFLDGVTDSSPINTIEGRRFYLQTYKFTMNGYLVDSTRFVKTPAINRALLFFETPNEGSQKVVTQLANLEITTVSFNSDGKDTVFNVNENIGTLLTVKVNGLTQEQGIDYFFIGNTSRITFSDAPIERSVVSVTYIKNKNTTLVDPFGNVLLINKEYFVYTGDTPSFTTQNDIKAIITFDVNGLEETQDVGYNIVGNNKIRLVDKPIINSKIAVIYIS
jgi:hypothetical protein